MRSSCRHDRTRHIYRRKQTLRPGRPSQEKNCLNQQTVIMPPPFNERHSNSEDEDGEMSSYTFAPPAGHSQHRRPEDQVPRFVPELSNTQAMTRYLQERYASDSDSSFDSDSIDSQEIAENSDDQEQQIDEQITVDVGLLVQTEQHDCSSTATPQSSLPRRDSELSLTHCDETRFHWREYDTLPCVMPQPINQSLLEIGSWLTSEPADGGSHSRTSLFLLVHENDDQAEHGNTSSTKVTALAERSEEGFRPNNDSPRPENETDSVVDTVAGQDIRPIVNPETRIRASSSSRDRPPDSQAGAERQGTRYNPCLRDQQRRHGR